MEKLAQESRFKVFKVLKLLGVAVPLAILAIAAFHFPYDVDAPLTPEELDKSRKYYEEAYRKPEAGEPESPSAYETKYIQMATFWAEVSHIKEDVEALAARHRLKGQQVLEIGSGRGYLQDVVEDYTGLDISPNVRRFYHKKFVLGSATALPFADESFDGGWSVWVLEHVPNPEQALRECRRVMRDGAVLILQPAWNVSSAAADGYRVRPYSDFGLGGKLIKAAAPIRFSQPYKAAERIPARLVRKVTSWFGPTTLHYTRLTPNYKEYWEPDSDGLNSLDRHEMMLWFQSRGDECLNCAGADGSIFAYGERWLVIRVNKKRK